MCRRPAEGAGDQWRAALSHGDRLTRQRRERSPVSPEAADAAVDLVRANARQVGEEQRLPSIAAPAGGTKRPGAATAGVEIREGFHAPETCPFAAPRQGLPHDPSLLPRRPPDRRAGRHRQPLLRLQPARCREDRGRAGGLRGRAPGLPGRQRRCEARPRRPSRPARRLCPVRPHGYGAGDRLAGRSLDPTPRCRRASCTASAAST